MVDTMRKLQVTAEWIKAKQEADSYAKDMDSLFDQQYRLQHKKGPRTGRNAKQAELDSLLAEAAKKTKLGGAVLNRLFLKAIASKGEGMELAGKMHKTDANGLLLVH